MCAWCRCVHVIGTNWGGLGQNWFGVHIRANADKPLQVGITLLSAHVSFFCLQPQEVYVDDEAKLTLHGLVQHYVMLNEEEKNRKLSDLLDALDFNQVTYKRCGSLILLNFSTIFSSFLSVLAL